MEEEIKQQPFNILLEEDQRDDLDTPKTQEGKRPFINYATQNPMTKYYSIDEFGLSQQAGTLGMDQKNNQARSPLLQLPSKEKEPEVYKHQTLKFHEENQQHIQLEESNFYQQATAVHKFPDVKVVLSAIYPHNPNIMATFSLTSPFFEENTLKEFISYIDYEKLSKIRTINYIAILRLFTRVDKSQKMYNLIRKKLYQVKALVEYLGIGDEKLYPRLHQGKQIYDLLHLDEEEKKLEDAKKLEEDKDLEKVKNADENQHGENDVNEHLYEEYFASALGQKSNGTPTIHRILEQEEEKWAVRAQWIDEMIKKLETREDAQVWLPWFLTQIEMLASLDVPVTQDNPEYRHQEVLYLRDFIKQHEVVNQEKYFNREDKVYSQADQGYPKFSHKWQNNVNEQYASLKCQFNLREKLCGRIQVQEKETQAFLTVFEKKPFGNEKIYQKRINMQDFDSKNLTTIKFNKNGQYLLLAFKDSTGDYNLVFPLKAPNKDPIMIRGNLIAFDDRTITLLDKVKRHNKTDKIVRKSRSEKKKGKKSKMAQKKVLLSDESEGEQQIDQDYFEKRMRKQKKKNVQKAEDKTYLPLALEVVGIPDEGAENLTFNELYVSIEDDEETVQTTFIIECDLNDKSKIKSTNLSYLERTLVKDDLVQFNDIQKCRDGLYFFFQKPTDKEQIFSIQLVLRNNTYIIDDKYVIEKTEGKPRLFLNEKGDKVLLAHEKDGFYVFQTYNFDSKDKYLKKDESLKLKHENTELNLLPKLQAEITSMNNNFLIAVQKEGDKEWHYFSNDQYLMSFIQEPDTYSERVFNDQDEVFLLEKYHNIEEKSFKHSQISKNTEKDTQEKLIKKRIQGYFFNSFQIMCFPYAYCIYNHDMVLMKDLTCKNGGYYYMNSFMGIEKDFRPITVHPLIYSQKYSLSITVINSKYRDHEFSIRVHQIKSFYELNSMFKFGGIIRFRCYSYNENIIAKLDQWSCIGDSKKKLHPDLRIFSKDSCLYIEQWMNNVCTARMVASHYEMIDSLDHNDFTQYQYIYDIPRGHWLFVTQVEDSSATVVQAYTHSMRYNFGINNVGYIRSCWDFIDDDANNLIYTILVDYMVKGEINLYIVYNDCRIKRFTAKIKDGDLVFEEYPHTYSVQEIFGDAHQQPQAVVQKEGKAAQMRKFNLFEQQKGDMVIANEMFYSSSGIIDLRAKIFTDKLQTGFKLQELFNFEANNLNKISYSINEAKLFLSFGQNYSQGGSRSLQVNTLVLPLMNTRQIPMFHFRQFIHHIVPIVDKERGCVYAFTIALNRSRTEQYRQKSHQDQMKVNYNVLMDASPGLIIKYFNGIEEKVPMSKFGEEFTQITRFKQSLDGKFVTIFGIRKGKLQDPDSIYSEEVRNSTLHKGIFLYKITIEQITLEQAFLFAEKDPSKVEQVLKAKLSKPSFYKTEIIEPEIQNLLSQEYSSSNLSMDGKFSSDYTRNIKYEEHDEILWEQLKTKKETDKKLLEDTEKKKLSKMTKKNQELAESQKLAALAQESPEKKKEEEMPKIIRTDDVIELFPGLDIPAFYALSSEELMQKETLRLNTIKIRDVPRIATDNKKTDEQQFNSDLEKACVSLFTEEQDTEIRKMHANMHLQVTSQGILLINRFYNKLYFFYKDKTGYKLSVTKFEESVFIIETADTSENYMILTGYEKKKKDDKEFLTHRYRIYNLKPFLECNDKTVIPLLENPDPNLSNLVFESGAYEKAGVKKALVGIDEYKYEILSCRLQGVNSIIHVKDQNTAYLKVFNIAKGVMTYYMEGEKFLTSGDGKFIWNQTTNEVYDIENSLSTFFFWPGDQVNSHVYIDLDLFTVDADRTILATQGSLHLAFNYMSYQIEEELHNLNFKLEGNDKTLYQQNQSFNYLCYKIGNYRSILEQIFGSDLDKSPPLVLTEEQKIEEQKKTELQKKEEEMTLQATQNKNLANFLNFLTIHYTPENTNQAHLCNFFFTYYYKNGKEVLKDPKVLPATMNIFEKMYNMVHDTRVDVIEDILNYVVSCKTVPITQQVINSCFTKFIENVHSSTAFQFYLNNSLIQTTKMQDIEKFQIPSPDLGFMLDTHDQPVVDDRFVSKFKDPNESKKDISIHYINLGTLIVDQGEKIMVTLMKKKYLPIMDIPFIQYLVMYQWQTIKSTIHKKLLGPFVALILLFTIYCIIIDFHDEEETFQVTARQIAGWINGILVIILLLYFYYIEALQLYKDWRSYFVSPWNVADFICYILMLIVVVFSTATIPNYVIRPIASVCLIVLWVKMFYFLRVFETTSRLIRMIIEIVNDMKNFLFVLLIAIIAFTGSFYVLQQGVPYPLEGEELDVALPGQPQMALIYTYRLAQGDFNIDFFDELDSTADFIVAWILFVCGTLFLVIVLLNLLIAIMGDTFSRVLENITNLQVREKVMLVSENEALFKRAELFQHSQFLIVFIERNIDSAQAENWDGQINALKRLMVDKVNTLHTDISGRMNENQKDIRKKIVEQEEKQRRQMNLLEQRIQSSLKLEINENSNKNNGFQQLTSSEIAGISKQVDSKMEDLKSDMDRLSKMMLKTLDRLPKTNDHDDLDFD